MTSKRQMCAVLSVLTLVMVVAVIVACEEEIADLGFAPSDCETQRPSVGPFEILVSIDPEFTEVPITIFRGEIEKNNIVIVDTLTQRSAVYDLFTETNYSAIAIYVVRRDTVAVIDASSIWLSRTEYDDKDCWDMGKGVADLQLRIRP